MNKGRSFPAWTWPGRWPARQPARPPRWPATQPGRWWSARVTPLRSTGRWTVNTLKVVSAVAQTRLKQVGWGTWLKWPKSWVYLKESGFLSKAIWQVERCNQCSAIKSPGSTPSSTSWCTWLLGCLLFASLLLLPSMSSLIVGIRAGCQLYLWDTLF